MAKKTKASGKRHYDDEFKQQAVQMLLDGHSAQSVCHNLGISNSSVLYRWKKDLLQKGGSATEALEARLRTLEFQLSQTQRERDILKKALGILSRSDP